MAEAERNTGTVSMGDNNSDNIVINIIRDYPVDSLSSLYFNSSNEFLLRLVQAITSKKPETSDLGIGNVSSLVDSLLKGFMSKNGITYGERLSEEDAKKIASELDKTLSERIDENARRITAVEGKVDSIFSAFTKDGKLDVNGTIEAVVRASFPDGISPELQKFVDGRVTDLRKLVNGRGYITTKSKAYKDLVDSLTSVQDEMTGLRHVIEDHERRIADLERNMGRSGETGESTEERTDETDEKTDETEEKTGETEEKTDETEEKTEEKTDESSEEDKKTAEDTPEEDKTGDEDEIKRDKGVDWSGEKFHKKDDPIEKTIEEPKPDPVTDLVPVSTVELNRGKLLKKSLQYTKIVEEPKKSLWRRIKYFASNHPILTAAVGGLVGAGLVAATAGVFAAGGFAASLHLASYWGTAIAEGFGLGAVAGGGVHLISRFTKGAKKERLYNKFKKTYDACLKNKEKIVSRANQIEAIREREQDFHQQIKAQRGMFKGAKRAVLRKARKITHWYGSRLVNKNVKASNQMISDIDKAATIKDNLNTREDTPGKITKRTKSLALNGYLQKRENLINKHANGKLSDEEFADEMDILSTDFEEEFGVKLEEVGGQKTFDAEMVKLIDSVDENHQSETMKDMKDRIEKRNSVEKIEVMDGVWMDEKEESKFLDEFKKKHPEIDANDVHALMESGRVSRQDFVDYVKAHGVPLSADDSKNTAEILKARGFTAEQAKEYGRTTEAKRTKDVMAYLDKIYKGKASKTGTPAPDADNPDDSHTM